MLSAETSFGNIARGLQCVVTYSGVLVSIWNSLMETSHSTPLSITVQSKHLKLNWKISFKSTQITKNKQVTSSQEWTCPCLKHGAPKCGTVVMCSPPRAIQSPSSLPGCSVSQSSHDVGAAAGSKPTLHFTLCP